MDQNFSLPVENNVAEKKDVGSALSSINQDFKEQSIAQKATAAGLGYVNLVTTPINPDYLRIITREEAESAKSIVYFRIGKKIKLAATEPERSETLSLIESLQKKEFTVHLYLTSEESFRHAAQLYSINNIKTEKEIDNEVDEAGLDEYEKEIGNLSNLEQKLKELSPEEAINSILVGAYKTGTSDVHIDPDEKTVNVRFRIDGVIQNVLKMEHKIYERVLTQIKYDGKMRLNISLIPQDGRTSFKINKNEIDVRISTLPTQFGETVLLRLLDSRRNISSFESLGYEGQPLEHLQKAIQKSHGMILVTGPTGSGKTTSLYAIVQKLNKPENKIITLEDPIEYHLANITQSQISEKNGYNFADALRASMRQDPDIIMVGEIRDSETAGIALQAALTGHIVLSTLHTNSAIESIPRLINMGIQPYMIAPAINAVVAQRLVRRVCSVCKIERPLSEKDKAEIEAAFAMSGQRSAISVQPEERNNAKFKAQNLSSPQIGDSKLEDRNQDLDGSSPSEKNHTSTSDSKLPTPISPLPAALVSASISGCDNCSHTGYKGRVAIAEVLLVDDTLRELIFEGASTPVMYEHIRKHGFITMREYGISLVLKGITTLEEVYRVATS